jgi:hypothetical protein
VANQSWDSFNRHLPGIGALILHGGVEGLNRISAREHFYGYRAIQAPFLFMNRQRSFLSSPEWIEFPWKKDLELAQHPLHTMLDIAFRALPEVAKQSMPRKWKLTCLEERLRRAWAVVDELNRWERDLRARNQGGLYSKTPATWGDLYEHYLEFSVFSSAVAFAMYTAVRIHVAALIAATSNDILACEPTADVSPKSAMLEAIRWSRLACQCLEFFHMGEVKFTCRLVTVWPLETAWELFARLQTDGDMDVSRELTWCRSTAARLASSGFPPFQWK